MYPIEAEYRIGKVEADISAMMKDRPGTVACDVADCDYVDVPAWVEDHKRRRHPATRQGHCTECGGFGVMVVTAEGLFHRYGVQCDEERNARHEDMLNRHFDL